MPAAWAQVRRHGEPGDGSISSEWSLGVGCLQTRQPQNTCPPSRLGSTSLIKARRGKRAGTSRLYARRLWKGRSIYSRATEKGPAFCECFVRAQRRASPLGPGCTSMICCATKEMMQPCLSYLHVISLVGRAPQEKLRAPGAPLPLAGVSIGTERECQPNDSLADGYSRVAPP